LTQNRRKKDGVKKREAISQQSQSLENVGPVKLHFFDALLDVVRGPGENERHAVKSINSISCNGEKTPTS